jgi:hypothetical protein
MSHAAPYEPRRILSMPPYIFLVSPWLLIIISPYVFTLTAWKIAIRTVQRRLILKVQKQAEVPV